MTERDRRTPVEGDISVLGPLAEHRLLIVPQVAVVMDASNRVAADRLRRLERRGWLWVRQIFSGLPAAVMITRSGLRAVGSTLAEPRLNLNEYAHEVGVAWLWLAARAGVLGDSKAVATERTMRAADAGRRARGELPEWGVGTGCIGRHGKAEYHYPDLMMELGSGERVAIELELSGKGAIRTERILDAYASEASVEQVVYVAGNEGVANTVRAAATRAGIPERVFVQLLAADGIQGAPNGQRRAGGYEHGRQLRSGPRAQATAPARDGASR